MALNVGEKVLTEKSDCGVIIRKSREGIISGTPNVLAKFTPGGTGITDSSLSDNGTDIQSTANIILTSAKQLKLNNVSNTVVGKVFGTSQTIEGTTYNGLQLQPQNLVGTSPGNIYIGDYYAVPSGAGIKVYDGHIVLYPSSNGQIDFTGALVSQETEGSELFRMKLSNATTPPTIGKGGLYYDTDDNNAYLNKGTFAAPNWQLFGVTDHGALTGLADDDHTQYLLVNGTRAMTGDLTIDKALPELILKNSGIEKGHVEASTSNFDIHPLNTAIMRLGITGLGTILYGSNIELSPDTSIIAYKPLAMQGNQITSTVATGTAPFTVASTTVVTNLNADLLDGLHASSFIANPAVAALDMNSYDIKRIMYLKSTDTVALTFCYGSTSPVAKLGIGTELTAYAALDMNSYDIKRIVSLKSTDGVALELRFGSTTPVTKLAIGTVLAAYANIAMSSNKITGLAAGTIAGDAVTIGQNLNQANLLAGLTPTFVNWTTNPGTNDDLVHELSASSLTVNGVIPTLTTCYIRYDMGISTRIVAQLYARTTTISNVNLYILGSDDDVDYYRVADELLISQNDYHTLVGILKCRYLRFYLEYQGTSGSATINSCNMRAYRL